jgi:hypothetical protein
LTDVDRGAGRLLARVIVNRLWQHHLGRGLVATPSDFGTRGEPPTHPELLDWLATELIRSGWSLKHVHRLILTSATYRQSSALDPARAAADPDNRLCWRRPARRLEAEAIRDALLAVTGELDRTPFGPGTLNEASRRRSVYFTVKRSKLVPMLQVFDCPDALSGMGQRPATTIAPQALLLLNNAQVRTWAHALARRLLGDGKVATAEVVRAAYVRALTREPGWDELAEGVRFMEDQAASYQAAGKGNGRELAVTDFCQALLCLNEFVFVE